MGYVIAPAGSPPPTPAGVFFMEYTNHHKLPKEIVDALTKDRYTDEKEMPSNYSITSLIAPIQQTILMKQFPNDRIKRDVISLFPSFNGSIGHAVLEEAWKEENGSIIEERLYADIRGRIISGKFDCYADEELRDYKFTKVYKIMKGDYSDWERQLNCYAELCEHEGYPVKRLRIFAFITDWKKHETYKENYPKVPILEIEIPLWTKTKRSSYLDYRVTDLINAEGMTPSVLADHFPCSDKEMWRDVVDYAVMKKGSTRAYRKFDNENDAMACLREKDPLLDKYEVIRRVSKRKRCLEWCDVAHICKQNQALLEEEGIDPAEIYTI